MGQQEQIVAEQVVALADHQDLTVRITQDLEEQFWRVEVTDPGAYRNQISTTVAPGDSFLMNLIEDAVGGQQVAWRHLAQWGRDTINRPGGRRVACA